MKVKAEDDIKKFEPHKYVYGVLTKDKINLFPINWLNAQGYCEYQIYLEYFKKIKIKKTEAMIEGIEEHKKLEEEFLKTAQPMNLDDIIEKSKKQILTSREFGVYSIKYGIFGRIDELIFTPDFFMIIDDKPGDTAYTSHIHQLYGYCFAFQDTIAKYCDRNIVAALRERGTDNIFWKKPFTTKERDEICEVINHIHDLINNKTYFSSSKNIYQCLKCSYNKYCDRF